MSYKDKIIKETGINSYLGYETPISNIFFSKESIGKSKGNYLKLDVVKRKTKKGEEVNYYKYLKYKGNETSLGFQEYYDIIKDQLGFYDVALGTNGLTGKALLATLAQNPYTHYSFIGQSGSGKSVAILWQLFQLYQKYNTEFFILKKSDGDFNIMFDELKKFKMILDSDLIEKEDFESFNNYLELDKIKRARLFKQYNVGNFRDYNKLYHEGGREKGMPTINLGIIVFDEYETARRRLISQKIDFDSIVSQWLNVFRSFGYVVIFGTQTFQKDNLGPIREGMSMHWCGNTSYVLTDNKLMKTNIEKGYINGTNSFINIGSGEYMKTPYNSEGEAVDILKKLEKEGDIIPEGFNEKKYKTGYLLLNDFIFENKKLLKASQIISNSSYIFKYLKIKELDVNKLKQTTHYLPFLILCFSIFAGHKRKIINNSFNIFEKPDLKEAIDRILYTYIEKYRDKDYNEFIKELKNIFIDNKSEDFIDDISGLLNLQLKRFAGIDELFIDMDDNDNKTDLFEQMDDLDDEIDELNDIMNENDNNVNDIGIDITISEENVEDYDKKKLLNHNSSDFSIELVNINPISVNSLYYKDKFGKVKTSSKGIEYKKKINNKIDRRMKSKNIKIYPSTGKYLVENIFTINKKPNKDGSLNQRGKKDLDNIQKFTIDALNKNLIEDDNSIYYLYSKINYELLEDKELKNKIDIKFYDKNKNKRINEIKESFLNYNLVYSKRIIDIGTLKSYNSMYNYNLKDKGKTLNPEVKEYKSNISKQLDDNIINITKGCKLAFECDYYYKNKEKDLDNLMKPVWDSMEGKLFSNDKQFQEMFIKKNIIKDGDEYFDFKIYIIE